MQTTSKKVQSINSRSFKQPGLSISWKCICSELIGTFMLTSVAILPVVLDCSSLAKAISPGLLVMVMTYALGNLSGAHFNPAVTLAFTLRGAFNWRKIPGYWIAQCIGATLAAIFVRAICGETHQLGATIPRLSELRALIMEIFLTFMLVFVVLGTSKLHKIVGNNAAIAVGSTIALAGIVGADISGASMNPARSLGPALVAGTMNSFWIYFVGPFVGSTLAVLIFTCLHGFANEEEMKAAEGTDALLNE